MSLKFSLKTLLFLLVFLLLGSSISWSTDASFFWLANDEPGGVVYRVHYGMSSRQYNDFVDVYPSSDNQVDGRVYGIVPGLDDNQTYYFAVTARINEAESDYSQEIVYRDGLFTITETPLGDGTVPPPDDGTVPPPDDGTVPPPGDEASPLDSTGMPYLEHGVVSVGVNWGQVSFSSPFNDPIIVAAMTSYNDSDPGVVRIQNVSSAGFEVMIQEPESLDGVHAQETVSYIVMERGKYVLADGSFIEAGSLTASGAEIFDRQIFDRSFNRTPVVMASISTYNGPDSVTGRIKNIDINGFEYMMQEQEAYTDGHTDETVSYIAWEPSDGTVDGVTYSVGRAGEEMSTTFTNIWYSKQNRNDFQSPPVVVVNMLTANGLDPAVVRCQNNGTEGIELKLQEEQSADSETDHTVEDIGYIALSKYILPQILPQLEAGEVELNHDWARVDFAHTYYQPVVVARMMSYNGSDPAVIRISDVDQTGFSIRIQEWDSSDDIHTTENVSYFVMEQGKYILDDGTRFEAGIFEAPGTTSFVQKTFMQEYPVSPVVVTSISSYNGSNTVTVRLQNIDNNGIEFMMQEQESNTEGHVGETISYIAWEPSNGTVEGVKYSVGTTGERVTDTFVWDNYDQQDIEAFQSPPVFVVGMQTANGMDPAALRCRNNSVSGVDIMVEEELSADDEIRHTTEDVGYIAISQ